MIQSGYILAAWSDDTDQSISDAREYIAQQGLTSDDVRLIKREGQAIVVAKRCPDGWGK